MQSIQILIASFTVITTTMERNAPLVMYVFLNMKNRINVSMVKLVRESNVCSHMMKMIMKIMRTMKMVRTLTAAILIWEK